ncbi:MAG: cytidyltransferase [Verrucomicrobiota bacterium]
MKIAMIPARMGSQRLAQKNLRELHGISLVVRAIRKCLEADCFDAVWVNSEHPKFGDLARAEGVNFHQRPEKLGDSVSTSEQYITEFLDVHECDTLYQVHSIAPLMTLSDIRGFVQEMERGEFDSLLSCQEIGIECSYLGDPVNFSLYEKTNSQDLNPIQRISWSITAWKRAPFLKAAVAGQCATYCGKVGYYPISHLAAHVIKDEMDLAIAEALYPIVFES